MIAGETEELWENLPQCHFVPPQIPHDQVRFRTPDRSGGKPATNCLSYGVAFYLRLSHLGQFCMEPNDHYNAPIHKVLHLFEV
jgi:hypothetical protein